MRKIIFERLTVKDEERVTAGNTSTNDTNTTSESAVNCSTKATSVGNGCLLEVITTNDKLLCAVTDNELNCGYEVKIKLSGG